MKKRIFVGIKISKGLFQEIGKWGKRYQKLDVRWVKSKNLHVTLVPPWHESEVDRVMKTLEDRAIKIKPFNVKFRKVTFGPNPKRPRLIWAEGKVPRELNELKTLLEKSLNKKPEKRDFRLHLTLARFKPKQFKDFSMKKLDDKIFWKDKVKSICIFESKLLRTGAEYEVLKRFSFKG